MGLNWLDEWDGVCACGKKENDGVRCRFGATHEPDKKHAFPWIKEKMPWEK